MWDFSGDSTRDIEIERQREKVHFSFAVPSGECNNNRSLRERQYGFSVSTHVEASSLILCNI